MWIELLLNIIILIYDTTHRFKQIAYCAFFKQFLSLVIIVLKSL